MRIKAYELLENYTPGSDDRLLVETDSGTKTILASKSVNPYTKQQLDGFFTAKRDVSDSYSQSQVDEFLAAKRDVSDSYSQSQVDSFLADKQDASGAMKFYDTTASGATTTIDDAKDTDTVYYGHVMGVGSSSSLLGPAIYAKSGQSENNGYQYGANASGKVGFRRLLNGTWGNWTPIGITQNIDDGAITIEKLNSAVYASAIVDTYINEGNSSATYKAKGICQKIAGLCTLVVAAKCTSSNTMNSFTLPNQFHANTEYNFYTDVSIWPTAQVPAKEYSIKISGDTCYIRTKDDSSLMGATVYFSITYIPSAS